jgi:hypothetical protein
LPSATLDPVRVRNALLLTVPVIAVLAVAGQLAREWAPGSVTANGLVFLDVTREESIPTLFSGTLLLAAAGAALALAGSSTRAPGRWRLLAALVAFLAIDELVGFHEASMEPLRRLLDTDGFLYYPWVLLAAGLLLIVVPPLRPVLDDLSRPQRRLLVIAAATFLGSAIGFELIEGSLAADYGEEDARLIPLATTEETLELIGAILFLYVLLDRLAPWQAALRVRG